MAAMSITQPIYKATPVLGIPHKWRLVDSEIRRRFLIACCDKLRGILAAQRDLCRAYPGIDCDKTPGWDETEEGRAAVLAQVTEMPAASLAGIAAKAEVLQISDVNEDSMWSDANRPVDRRRRPPAAQRGRGAQRCRVPAGQRPRPWLSPSSTASAPRACLSN